MTPTKPRLGTTNFPLSFLLILRRSLLHRRARSLSALVALSVSAAVATALLTLYADLDAKLHHEFRSFGANVIVTMPSPNPADHSLSQADTLNPEEPDAGLADNSEGHGFSRANNQPAEGASALPKAALSDPATLARIKQAAGPDALLAPFAYAVATTDRNIPVVVAGTDLPAARRLNTWWQTSSPDTQTPLIGQKVANFIASEHPLTLTFAGKPLALPATAHLRTGGDEDSRIYIPLTTFTQWTGTQATVLELQIPGGAANVEAALTRLRQALPTAQVAPVRQLVEGESRIVDRTHALMYAAVILIALTVAVSVLATLSASVLERRRDFALMKALGGTQLQLLLLFLVEALVLALAGVLIGYLVGSGAALLISEANFHTAALPRLSVLPLVLALNLVIATCAALFPTRALRNLQPAALLKGE